MATSRQRFFYLVFLTSIAACGGSGDPANENPPANQTPSADAGAAQTVDERSIVNLTGSGSDADGTISSYAWSQTSGTSVTLENSGNANAHFRAPNIPADETLVFQLRVTDDKGATGSASVDINVLDNAAMLITAVKPSFGVPGDRITIELQGGDVQTTIRLAGAEIVPEAIEQDSTIISFAIPDAGITGPLRAESGDKRSNSMWFSVGDAGIVESSEDKIVFDDLGNRVSLDYVGVVLARTEDSADEAERLANLVSGMVVGRIALANLWQIDIEASSLAELETIVSALEAEASVEAVIVDMEVGTDAIDWTKDPDHPDQRYRNRVEEGASLYEAKVSPTIPDRVRPFFMSIGVSETGVDFGVPDFSSFSPSGTSGNVSVYGLQDSSDSDAGRHGTNVAGIIAADLEDMGNAGLVNALSDFHGGANLDVGGGSIMVLPRLSRTERQLESGALVINWSWGLHKKGVIACTGAEVENNVVNSLRFASKAWLIRRFFENTLVSFPQAVIVATAGNGLTDAGDADARMPSSVVSPNMIVVGAHTTGGTVLDGAGNTHDEDVFASNFCFPEDRVGDGSIKRAWYSNFGHKVDISASGSIKGIRNVTHASQAQGTSFAAPLVSATIALMQSINPNLTPADVKSMLRSSALGMENEVAIAGSDAAEFATRPLSEDEKGAGHEDIGKGARLNVQGAIQAALDSLGDETLQIDEPYTINLGEGVDEVTVQISTVIPAEGAVFDKVDIMFLVDVSSSYNDDIATFRDKANELIDAFAGAGNNVQIGLASFSDYPQSPYGGSNDYEFRLDQPLTSDFDSIRTGLDALTILYGGDYPESQLEALNQTAQSDAGWRPGALPVIFLATDASFHNSDEESEYPGTGYDETLTTLNDGSITVFGFQSGGTLADVIQIATDTGGEAFVLSRDSAEIVAAVQDAIGAANSDLVVSLKPFGDFADLVRSITPADIVGAEPGDPITGVNPGDTVNFDVVFSRGIIDDGGSHTFSFRLRVVANDVAIIIEIPVTVILN